MWGGKHLFTFVGGGAAGLPCSLTAGTDLHVFTIPFRCRPIRSGITLTTTINSAANTVVKFDHRPTAGSDASRGDGDLGTLNIVTTTAAGKAVYEDTDNGTLWVTTMNEGDQVVVQLITVASVAGAGVPWLVVEVDPEMPANNAAMIAA